MKKTAVGNMTNSKQRSSASRETSMRFFAAIKPRGILQLILVSFSSKRQTMRTYANFKKYERMLLTVIAKTSRCYHRKEHSL